MSAPDPQQNILNRLCRVIRVFNDAAKLDMFEHRDDPRLLSLPANLAIRRDAVYAKIDAAIEDFALQKILLLEDEPPQELHDLNYKTALYAVELAEIAAESLLRNNFKDAAGAQQYLPLYARGNAEIADLFEIFSAPYMAQICRLKL